MQIQNEEEILNEEVRKNLIEFFDQDQNARRKAEAFKAYECLKDKTIHYVADLLSCQFDVDTVNEMQGSMTNISILRKVIDKLAKVYASGVKRTMPGAEGSTEPNADETKGIEEAAEYLDINTAMKKANRYFRAFKNTLVFPKPVQNEDRFDIEIEVLPPFYYDAVEDSKNPKRPLAIIISDYKPSRKTLYSMTNNAGAREGRTATGTVSEVGDEYKGPAVLKQAFAAKTGIGPGGGGADDNRTFIWWTKSYHFTTNAKGQIISQTGTANEIKELPFVNLCGEQDGQFWAEGGDDLVDAGIKINVGITNAKHVGISQGYGQLYMIGAAGKLPKSVRVGPTHVVQLEYNKDEDSPPEIGFLNSNPPLGDLKAQVEMEVALMLSTNNLSVSSFATSLQAGKDFASGIALMIDKAESIEDIDEQAKIFIKKEPEVWAKVKKWQDVYNSKGLLSDKAKAMKLPKEPEKVQLQFPSPKPVVSEKEQLEVLTMRKEMGLNTEVEILMRDDPSLTEEQAKQKLAAIKKEKEANMQAAAEAMGAPMPGQEGEEGEPFEEGEKPQGGLNGNPGQKSGGKQFQNRDDA